MFTILSVFDHEKSTFKGQLLKAHFAGGNVEFIRFSQYNDHRKQ